MSTLTRTLQRWLQPLERLPLHPQWLVLRHRRHNLAWIRAHARGVVVDVGCGHGQLRAELGDAVEYVGIDYPSTVALGYAGRADIFADAASLPLPSGSADTLALLDVLEHLGDPERAVAEAARVLRDGGKCLIHVPFLYPLHDEPHDYRRWTRHGLERLLARHGFGIVELDASLADGESAAALVSLALAKGAVELIERKGPGILAVPLLLAAVPFVNLAGWLLGRLVSGARIMPFSYRAVLRKVGHAEACGAGAFRE